MQVARKRSQFTKNNSLPPGLRFVEYIEKTSGSSYGGSYFIAPSKTNYMAGDNTIIFSFGPSCTEISYDRKMMGESDSNTTHDQTERLVTNRLWIINSKIRPSPFMGKYNLESSSITLQKNVIYTIQTKNNPVSTIITTSTGQSEIEPTNPQTLTQSCYPVLFSYKTWNSQPDSASLGTRFHQYTMIANVDGFTSIDMRPAEYQGRPCFYDTVTKTICEELGGSGYFSCGPYIN